MNRKVPCRRRSDVTTGTTWAGRLGSTAVAYRTWSVSRPHAGGGRPGAGTYPRRTR